jgi:hypothetical protein
MSVGFNIAKALRREIIRKHRQVGFWGTVKHASAKLFRDIRALLLPSAQEVDTFDALYGTDTGGFVGVGSLDIPEYQMEHAIDYGAISEEEFARIMRELPIDWTNLVFVDLGSGKGRALLLASRYPFKQVIGVELSRMLHEIALRNIALFHDESQKCRDIRSIHLDASLFEIPQVPVLFFMLHPFDDHVMRLIASHIDGSLKKQPRKVYVWYIKPEYRKVFDEMTCLNLRKDTGRYVFYESTLPA